MTETYATLFEADAYLGDGLGHDSWFELEENDKLKALVSATRLMKTLPWDGLPAKAGQALWHPVAGETEIPEPLKQACSEIASALIEGRNVEQDYRQVVASSERFGQVSVTRDTQLLPPHLMAAIPSLEAWRKIRPYLRNELGSVELERTD